ncbi:PAP2 superfamily protein [Winogradskyella wandonensis]|uniref:PAP2 superfamily protein n=1 Tax=Winogradskyella wandonensis TaxID=1442586 RepID=A0A4R1KK73_9FLAO|nr:phosphatase PAP2 family protein [Winogradskyella wandonensis]TCK64800.1 PAP2 superfamily protein [Winogradskyella wandonensis]
MRKQLLFSVIVLLLVSKISYGQLLNTTIDSTDNETIWQLAKYDTKQTLKSVGHAFTQPLRWNGKDFTKLGILIGGTAAMTFADEPLQEFIQRQAGDFPRVVRDFGWYFGSPQNYFMANAGLYGFGLFTKNEKIRKTSVLIISSSITSGLIQTFTKNAIGRARPSREAGHLEFSSFANESSFRSFPSGHTVLSVTMAHAIAKQFENTWVKAGIYTIGAIPPISRLIDDAHWFTDIAFSTVLSIIVVDGIDKFLFEEKAYDYPQKQKTISWNLKFAPNQVGIVGTF